MCTLQPQASQAANLPDLDPEITASSWEQGSTRCATVSLNGKEVIRLQKAVNQSGAAGSAPGALAEDVATKLDDLVRSNHFEPNKILPAKDGSMVSLRIDGTAILRFSAEDTVNDDGAKPTPLETSLKLANSIRSLFGATTLPQSFVKVVEIAQDGGVGKAVNHFSGSASWYGGKFHGRKTSDGTRYDQEGLTAAHRSLPFGTKLLVMNRKTGDSCVVKVNDRGPFVGGRVIDLSKGAAKQLNMLSTGVAMVDCLVLDQP
jgi:rare lipoprotein A